MMVKKSRKFNCGRKKRNGTVEDMLIPIIVILAISILMFAFLDVLSLISLKEDAKEIARKYILEMETTGYLSAGSDIKLRQELMAIGVTDITLDGTTYTDVGYGNEIHLYISGNLPAKVLDGNDLFTFVFKNEKYPISVHKMSTAKN